MDEKDSSNFNNFSQEVIDLINKTVEDINPSRAVKRMEEAIKRGLPEAQAATAYMVLGTRYEDLGQPNEAINCYSKSIQLLVNNPMVYFWRGELLFQKGQREEARADLEKALSFAPPNGLFSPERELAQDYLTQINRSS